MYIYLNHFTTQQKLTHCKATIIQVLKKALPEDKIMDDMKETRRKNVKYLIKEEPVYIYV